MSTSGSNKGRSGLRMLWIPGKKKQHHKGRYDTTNKNVDIPHKQKKIEPWAMGGVRGQSELLKTEIPGVSVLPAAMNVLPAAVPAAGVVNSVSSIHEVNETKPEISEEDKKLLETADKDICLIDDDSNTATLAIKDLNKKKMNKENSIDSIEKAVDESDAVIVPNNSTTSNDTSINGSINRKKSKKSKKRKGKKNKGSDNLDEEDNDPAIKCLYYALMCCECSIS